MVVLIENLLAQLVKKFPAFTKNVKAVSVHNKTPHSKSKWRNGGIDSLILNLATRFSFTPSSVYVRGESLRYSLNWRLSGFRRPLSRFGGK
jgi:hypothetical protein